MLHLADILEVENDPELLAFKSAETGDAIWPLVRTPFIRSVISALYYNQALEVVPELCVSRWQAVSALMRAWAHNLNIKEARGQVMIMASGVGHTLRDGLWFNRITDYFALDVRHSTVTVEGVRDWRIPEPRSNPTVHYFLPQQTTIALSGRVLKKVSHVQMAHALLEYFCARSRTILDVAVSDRDRAALTEVVASRLARLRFARKTYQQLLAATAPRVVLVEEACYSHMGLFNCVAREMGIRVAEPQHGMVSGGHDAYCVAPALNTSAEFQRYLPHDFLGYGAWWNAEINVPVQKWAIGSPHYTEQRLRLRKPSSHKNIVLLLSDGIETSIYIALGKALAERLGGSVKVVLRPHPLERRKVLSSYPDGRIDEIFLDINPDIYLSLQEAHVVAGEVSTALFEAVGLADRVFLWATPKGQFTYPHHPFATFTDADSFVQRMHEPIQNQNAWVETEIWAPNWRQNFNQYIDHALNGASS